MDKHLMPGNCLSDEVLWDLAFRLAGWDGDGAAIASGEGPSESFPGDLFLEDEGMTRDHLNICNLCNEELRRHIQYVREYSKRTKDPDVQAIAETITEGFLSREESKLLRFCPYEEDDEARHHALAAQTASAPKKMPLRFISEDEELILRAFEDKKTGVVNYYLTGNDPSFVRNTTVVFKGKRCASDSEGRIDFGDATQDINEETEFIILRSSQDKS